MAHTKESGGWAPTSIDISCETTQVAGVADERSARPELAAELVGNVLDEKYRLARLVGLGGMGAVYKAEHVGIGCAVAVKILFPEVRRRRESIRRFRREARAAGTIGHPNIVKVFDMGTTHDGLSYMVMEFVEGESLADVIARTARLEPGRVIRIAEEVLAVLDAAHLRGIIHRDIKPENVMITADETDGDRVRVLDFGVSKIRPTGPDVLGLTQTGMVLGTPMFMPPEQARGDTDIDHRADLYSVGTLMYVMLSGRCPYKASNLNALLATMLTEAPEPLESFVPNLDPHLADVVRKAMERRPDDRFQTAQQFVAALRGRPVEELPRLELAETLEPTSVTRPATRRVSILSLVALTVAAGLAVSVGLWAVPFVTGPAQAERRLRIGAARLVPDDVDAEVRGHDPFGAETPEPGSAIEPATSAMITVRITTWPEDALVLLNGSQVDNPVEERMTRGSGEPVVVRVEADGYLPLEKLLSRATDVEEHLSLERAPRRSEVPRER